MHFWGDDWFQKHGKDLDAAIEYCCRSWRKWGRIGNHGKEKYGTFRDQLYPYRGDWPIHELVKPGYVYYQWPRWMIKFECRLGTIVQFLKLPSLVLWYQRHVYNYVIQQACKKWPNVVDELISDLDGYEWVKPGMFGPIDGVKIHKKYWKSCK